MLALKRGRPRRAALVGVASIGLASATANLVGKGLLRRARPDRAGLRVPAGRKVRMPGSTSFPSGHSASAFAFATAVGDELPLAWLPLHAVAAAVTYSRVHTGVHYPGDVLVGSLMGTGAAVAVRYTGRALARRSAGPSQPGGPTMSGSAGPVLSRTSSENVDRSGGRQPMAASTKVPHLSVDERRAQGKEARQPHPSIQPCRMGAGRRPSRPGRVAPGAEPDP